MGSQYSTLTAIPLSSFPLFMASPETERAQDSPWAIGALAEEAPHRRLRFASEAELGSFLSFVLFSCILYLDLEGNKLSRRGTISLITLLVYPAMG